MFTHEWETEKIDRLTNLANPVPFGVPYLDDALIGLLPNDLMLVGAKTGRGKTELATNLAQQMARGGKRVAFFALEADQWEIHRRMKYRRMQRIYFQEFVGTKADFHFPRYREWLALGFDRRLNLIETEATKQLDLEMGGRVSFIYKGQKFTAQEFVKQMEALAPETDAFIVDHLHYFDMLANDEHAGLKAAAHAVRNAAIFNNKPVILLAHLRKSVKPNEKKTIPDLEDFHGHSDIVKVATTVLLLSPVPADRTKPGSHFPTYFHIAKARTAAEVTPFVAIHNFDIGRGAYSERYELERARLFEDPEKIAPSDLPNWAKRAHRGMYAA